MICESLVAVVIRGIIDAADDVDLLLHFELDPFYFADTSNFFLIDIDCFTDY